MGPVEAIILLGLLGVVVAVVLMKEARLSDPDSMDTIYLNQIREACRLADGQVSVVLLRQSGNVYRDLGILASKDEAMLQVERSFRRANISAVFVDENTEMRFRIVRLHHSHRGKAEGKKLGGAVIERI
ncbi:MAG: hypothetical protein GYB53_18260 [Rhodobacteraceae bacterium]|nr:hypothetical protein [Paracoccaceae bacterium]